MFESPRVANVLTGVAVGLVLTACSGSSESSAPTDHPTAVSAPSTTWDSMPAPGKEQEVRCIGDEATEGSIVFADPGDYNFVFTAPDNTAQSVAIGRLSATLTVYNPPVNGRDTHLTWKWLFPADEATTITDDKREAQRHIDNTTHVMSINPVIKAPGKPQLAVSCLSRKD